MCAIHIYRTYYVPYRARKRCKRPCVCAPSRDALRKTKPLYARTSACVVFVFVVGTRIQLSNACDRFVVDVVVVCNRTVDRSVEQNKKCSHTHSVHSMLAPEAHIYTHMLLRRIMGHAHNVCTHRTISIAPRRTLRRTERIKQQQQQQQHQQYAQHKNVLLIFRTLCGSGPLTWHLWRVYVFLAQCSATSSHAHHVVLRVKNTLH